jgi:hypothetical protein
VAVRFYRFIASPSGCQSVELVGRLLQRFDFAMVLSYSTTANAYRESEMSVEDAAIANRLPGSHIIVNSSQTHREKHKHIIIYIPFALIVIRKQSRWTTLVAEPRYASRSSVGRLVVPLPSSCRASFGRWSALVVLARN